MARTSTRTGSVLMGQLSAVHLPVQPRKPGDTVLIEAVSAKNGYSPMTTVAAFTLLPRKALTGLREVALQKGPVAKGREKIKAYLLGHGKPLVHYYWSGFIMGTLLVYLQEKRYIDLMKSEFDELGFSLTKIREGATFILTAAHKKAYLSDLKPATYSESELRAYYEAVNQRSNADSGRAMLDGISLIRINLFYVASDSIIVLTIG
jgi:hypothetical protein